ncbi:hypothetical protein bthur0011_54290 [Bacillus thuringiensis serovar huazhongensis BGSC 4BD1]|nr:hypothetical protein bthur0011_54290 [Bacillus thuringiensis serovar huazhongensis BGSC 4BD1]
MFIFHFIIGKGGGSGPFPIKCFVGIRNNKKSNISLKLK